jgi:protein ImuB
MSRELYACIRAAEFPAQALVRLRPDLQAEPVAVLDGSPPQETVCALNHKARQLGATPGMTRLEAEAIAGLKLLPRSVDSEAAARQVLLECAARFSPRIEEAGEETACAFVLDIAGTERLFGPPLELAKRLRASLAAAGFRASVSISLNFHAARLKAAGSRGIAVIAAHEEAGALENLPVSVLDLAEVHAETFALWGIRTLGQLARLPEAELVVRLGAEARLWSALARGEAAHVFQPMEQAFALEEYCEFNPIEQIDSLLFVGSRMIELLTARAASRSLALASLTAKMKLEGGGFHLCGLRPALPSRDRKFLLKLLQLEIGAHPPQAAVISLRLSAEAGPTGKMQLGLFTPQLPEPSRLDVTLARLKAIVGEDRVGSPALEDTHRAGSFRMEDFAVSDRAVSSRAVSSRSVALEPQPSRRTPHIAPRPVPRIALRRLRPPVPVRVELSDLKPAAFREGLSRYQVEAACGPWRTSGCWWSDGHWDTEEWDVLAVEGDGASVACVLTCDRSSNRWQLEAFYD